MWSFEVMNKETKERKLIFGWNWTDAVLLNGIDETEWVCLLQSYED